MAIFSNNKNSTKFGVASLHDQVHRQKGKRKNARIRNRAIVGTVVIMLASASAYLGALWVIQKMFIENPRYSLAHVEIEATGKLRRDQILAWAEIPQECNIFQLNLKDIRNNLERQSSISKAIITRRMPDRLIIKVTERRPLARIVLSPIVEGMEAEIFSIDRDGVVMKPRRGEDIRGLPEIRGLKLVDITLGKKISLPEVFSALTLIELLDLSSLKTQMIFEAIDLSKEGVLTAKMKDGGVVHFSLEAPKMPTEISRFNEIFQFSSQMNKKIESADLTVARNVPVKFQAVEDEVLVTPSNDI